MNAPMINRIEFAKMIATPIFGGTGPTPPAGTPQVLPGSDTNPPAGTPAPGGSAPQAPADPVAQLQSDPNALAQLLNQTQTLQSQVQQLTENLQTVTGERDQFVQDKEQAERAQMAEIDQVKQDLQKAQEQIAKRDNIIQQKVIENAIANNKKFEWHNSKLVQAELDQAAIKLNIDVDKGIAEIEGVDAELDRIAGAHSYLVSKNKTETPPDGGTPPAGTPPAAPRQRTSGTPPRPPAPPQDKAAKRALAMKKFPTLAASGAKV